MVSHTRGSTVNDLSRSGVSYLYLTKINCALLLANALHLYRTVGVPCHRYCLSTEDSSTQPKTRVVLFGWSGYLPLGGLIRLLNLNRDVDEMY